MNRCLSDRALLRLHVGGGRSAQQYHVDGCWRCADRAERLRRDVDRITWVLAETLEPHPIRAGMTRRWLPAISLALVAVAAVVWVESAVWRAATPVTLVEPPTEAAPLLRDISTVMFSISGDPTISGADLLADLTQSWEMDAVCDLVDWLDGACGGPQGTEATLVSE